MIIHNMVILLCVHLLEIQWYYSFKMIYTQYLLHSVPTIYDNNDKKKTETFLTNSFFFFVEICRVISIVRRIIGTRIGTEIAMIASQDRVSGKSHSFDNNNDYINFINSIQTFQFITRQFTTEMELRQRWRSAKPSKTHGRWAELGRERETERESNIYLIL